ncbi:hypothetical protein [Arthrobacter sp. H35-D1]|uniref:hypothetical protein n=1 Tax=Arthrobacter sp. H35-D1 TaxID=3046202 RepID=UPI0024BA3050|nr:hypothetical protein [Arthrobacter sp. H35-D1]MDJ0311676.1 hypothetical protein [Arthrobacter sp. H35-D1]
MQHPTKPSEILPGSIPPGFVPSDQVCDLYTGKGMKGDRWIIAAEWVRTTNEFTLTFWTTDDDPMTASETRKYSHALLEMSSYITTMENVMAKRTVV